MACNIQLRTDLLEGADSGGTWAYIGYNTSKAGSPYTGYNIGSLNGDNPIINTSALPEGYHKFIYTVPENGACPADSQDVHLYIFNHCNYEDIDLSKKNESCIGGLTQTDFNLPSTYFDNCNKNFPREFTDTQANSITLSNGSFLKSFEEEANKCNDITEEETYTETDVINIGGINYVICNSCVDSFTVRYTLEKCECQERSFVVDFSQVSTIQSIIADDGSTILSGNYNITDIDVLRAALLAIYYPGASLEERRDAGCLNAATTPWCVDLGMPAALGCFAQCDNNKHIGIGHPGTGVLAYRIFDTDLVMIKIRCIDLDDTSKLPRAIVLDSTEYDFSIFDSCCDCDSSCNFIQYPADGGINSIEINNVFTINIPSQFSQPVGSMTASIGFAEYVREQLIDLGQGVGACTMPSIPVFPNCCEIVVEEDDGFGGTEDVTYCICSLQIQLDASLQITNIGFAQTQSPEHNFLGGCECPITDHWEPHVDFPCINC